MLLSIENDETRSFGSLFFVERTDIDNVLPVYGGLYRLTKKPKKFVKGLEKTTLLW